MIAVTMVDREIAERREPRCWEQFMRPLDLCEVNPGDQVMAYLDEDHTGFKSVVEVVFRKHGAMLASADFDSVDAACYLLIDTNLEVLAAFDSEPTFIG